MSHQSYYFLKHLSKKRQKKLFDQIVMGAAFVYPLTGVPQAISVLNGNTEGVAIISWIGFILFSILFLAYGIVHNVKPMVITNSLWLFVDTAVVIGILINS